MARAAARDRIAGPEAEHGLAPWGARPGTLMLVVRRDPESGDRVLAHARWGIPRLGHDMALHLRSETVLDGPDWDRAIRHRRLLVPVDAYEQRATRGAAAGVLHRVAPAEDAPLAIAGIWAQVEDGLRFAILTRAATGPVAPIHDRMPVIIPPVSWPLWLGEHDLLREGLALLMTSEPPDGLRVMPQRHMPRESEAARQMRLLGLDPAEPKPRLRAVAAAISRKRRRALG